MDRPRVTELLGRWIAGTAPEEGLRWLKARRNEIAGGAPKRVFFASFSAVVRYLGKVDLQLTASDREAAEAARPGWQPARWSVDQAGRALLALDLLGGEPSGEAGSEASDEPSGEELATLERVFDHADVGESVALYQALPLLPRPERHRARAAEGVRSNMTPVFNAVALYNPYPAEQFDDTAWNQLVLKAVFVGSPLYAIYGLDERANERLARMLVDYAHERWAAGRAVTPELWRPVGPFADDALIDDLERVVGEGAPAEREAAALALAESPSVRADEVLAAHPKLRQAIEEGDLTWERLSEERLSEERLESTA